MTLPGAEPLAFQTTIFRFSSGKPQPLILFPDSTLGTDEGLVCNSTFAWNSSPNSVLGTVGGSCSSPLCLESILDASVLGVCWFNPFPKPPGELLVAYRSFFSQDTESSLGYCLYVNMNMFVLFRIDCVDKG